MFADFERETIEISCDIKHVADVLSKVSAGAERAGLSKRIRLCMMLATEEIVANAILHGSDCVKHPVRVLLDFNIQCPSVTVEHKGDSFDPSQRLPSLSISPNQIGGFGVKLAQDVSSNMHYVHRDGLNSVTIEFN